MRRMVPRLMVNSVGWPASGAEWPMVWPKMARCWCTLRRACRPSPALKSASVQAPFRQCDEAPFVDNHALERPCSMLRLAVIVLLLANAGYFAWSQGHLRQWGYGPQEQAEPQRMNQQIRPETLQILRVNPSKVSAAPAATVARNTLAN